MISIHAGVPLIGKFVGNDRHFAIEDDGHLTLRNITLRYGQPKVPGPGGCIYVAGNASLIVQNSTIADCFVPGDYAGGIIHNLGEVLIINSELRDGWAGSGGAINSAGKLTIIESSIHDNNAYERFGGALAIGGVTEIHDSSFDANEAQRDGGALYHVDGGRLTMNDVVVSGNKAKNNGGGLFNDGIVEALERVDFIGNSADGEGGGIFNTGKRYLDMSDGRLQGNKATAGGGVHCGHGSYVCYFFQVTFDQNEALTSGGGLWTEVDVLAQASLFSENSAGTNGGAIYLGYSGSNQNPAVYIWNTTLSANEAQFGGALYVTQATFVNIAWSTFYDNEALVGFGRAIYWSNSVGTEQTYVRFHHTILANSAANQGRMICTSSDAQKSFQSAGNNIVSDGSCDLDGSGDWPNSDPRLLPLADNGGPTKSHMLKADSPAIDNGVADCDRPDQRGYPRPSGPACDIGAIEYGADRQTAFLPVSLSN